MNQIKLAPVLLFTYKRLDTLKQTVNALQQNYLASQSELFIFSDAAKNDFDIATIKEIRDYLKTIKGFKQVHVIEASANKGLANSIIDGVSQVINEYGKVIVLEDDLITTKNFLSFMNASLNEYLSKDNVFSISGYSFNLNLPPDGYDETGYFLNRGWSWGWATWADRWKKIDWQIHDYNSFINDNLKKKEFSKGGSDLTGMLSRQMKGKIDSWAIRWFYNQYKLNGLTFYPVFSKVFNIGFGDAATHTTGSNKRYIPNMDKSFSEDFVFSKNIILTKYFQNLFLKKMGYASRIRSRTQSLVLKIAKSLKFENGR